MPFVKLKPGVRQKPIGQAKRKLADLKLEEKSGSAHDVQRRCADCYRKIRKQEARETIAMAAKRVKTFCPDCGKFFCLDCFNEKYSFM